VRIDLSQVMDMGSDTVVCLFMCRCCSRQNVVDDGLKLGSGGTEVLGLSSGRN
jgi:hypothetical protein